MLAPRGCNLARAESWHDKMIHVSVKPNAHSYSVVINAYTKAGEVGGAEATELWQDRFEQAGMASDVIIYSSVIDACGKVDDAECAMYLLR